MKRVSILVLFLLSCGKGNLINPSSFTGQGGIGGGESCLVDSSESATDENQIEGTLELVFIDDFKSHQDNTKSYLVTDIEEKILLTNDDLVKKLPVGSKLRLTGATLKPSYQVTDDASSEREFEIQKVQLLTDHFYEIKNYNLKALMIIMDFSNRVTSNIYPLTQGKKDLKDIADYYRRVSGNQIDMKTDVNADGEQDVEVVNMGTTFSGTYCTPYLDNYVKNKLTKHNFSDYTTVIFVAAQTKSGNDPVCGYGGVANIGPLGSGINGRTHIGIPLNSVTVHELGHTFGLGHSGKSGCTYCDQVDPMGNYFGNLFQYFNGPKIKQLGLFDNRTELEHVITSSGIYPISAVGLGMKSANTTPRLLTISGTTPHYLTYRHTSGEDVDLPSSLSSFKGVVVNTGSIAGGGQSVYHKVLKFNGDSYTSGGITVKLLSDINNPEAEVEIIINGSSGNPTPAPTPKCLSSKVITTLQSVKKVGTDEYEVAYSVDNQNAASCATLDYNLSLNSADFELSQASSFSISAGQKINVITKIKIKAGTDLSVEKDATGTLTGEDFKMKLGEFNLPFNKTIGGSGSGGC
jgi:hypothetical protein